MEFAGDRSLADQQHCVNIDSESTDQLIRNLQPPYFAYDESTSLIAKEGIMKMKFGKDKKNGSLAGYINIEPTDQFTSNVAKLQPPYFAYDESTSLIAKEGNMKMKLGKDKNGSLAGHINIESTDRLVSRVVNMQPHYYADESDNYSESSPLITRKVISEGISEENAREMMSEKLSNFFMSTLDKWRIRKRFPWKMVMQIMIITTCAAQMALFGYKRMEYVKVNEDMTASLKRVILKDWAPAQEENPVELYAVYTAPQLIRHVDYTVEQYLKIRELSAESYGYDSNHGEMVPVEFCLKHYPGNVTYGNHIEGMDGSLKETCFLLPPKGYLDKPKRSILNQTFIDSNFALNFGTLYTAKLSFCLKSVIIRSESGQGIPECHRVQIRITYDNKDNAGPIFLRMSVHSKIIACHLESSVLFAENHLKYSLRQSLNFFLILLSLISMSLCLRSLYRGIKLCQETTRFFKYSYEKDIPIWERLDFIDFWYIVIVLGDAMVISGSLLNLQLEEKHVETHLHMPCSIFLGVGLLLILIGTLRYFKFFPRYNVLLITMKKAVPNILRFLLCILCLFLGYCLCGWIVLSPYHPKFGTLSSTSECLFAIMNGDDVFGSFNALNTGSGLVWWFSRVYLYSFFFLFMYLAASLLISVIMDAFESVKYIYQHGETPSSTVEKFLAKDVEYFPISGSSSDSDIHSEEKPKGYIQKLLVWLK